MRTTITLVALCLLTAGCGSNMEQRTATGALTGAGVGALAGGPIGAAVGAAVGGVGGAATPVGADQAFNKALGISHQSVAQSNFPPPAGAKTGAVSGTSAPPPAATTPTTTHAPMSRDTVRKIQRSLRQAGDNPGPIDGIVGPRTQAALRHYQQREGLPVTGTLDAQTMQRLAANAPPAPSSKQHQPQAQPSGEQGRQTGQLNSDEITQRLEAAGYSNVTGIENAGPADYHARADRGNATYALDIDGRTGTIKSLRQVSGTGMPSSGTSAPAAAPNGQGGAMGSTPGAQPAPGAPPQAQPGQPQPAPGTTAPGQPQQ